MIAEYEAYLRYKSENEYSENTIKTYKFNIAKFLQWLQERYTELNPAAVTSLDLKEYQSYLLNIKKYEPKGIHQRMNSVLSYCRFLYERKYLKADITAGFKLVKVQTKSTAPDTPSTVEVNRFRREVYKSNKVRDIAVIEMFLNTGIRAGELVALEVDDLELGERKGLVRIREGKGGKYRDIPLNSDVRKALENYIKKYSPKDLLWVGQRGYITQDAVNKMIKRYATKVGLQDKIHPHSLRHYFATRLLREKKADIVIVAEVLGHSNINTTRVYTKPSSEEVANVLEDLNT